MLALPFVPPHHRSSRADRGAAIRSAPVITGRLMRKVSHRLTRGSGCKTLKRWGAAWDRLHRKHRCGYAPNSFIFMLAGFLSLGRGGGILIDDAGICHVCDARNEMMKGEAALTREVNPAAAWPCATLVYQGEHDPKALLGVPKAFVAQ